MTFAQVKTDLVTAFPEISRTELVTVQVNTGYLCNQSCRHCHVDAGPKRKEIMSRKTAEEVLAFAVRINAKAIDLTGGAPELNPNFRFLVESAKSAGLHVIDRCNLTVLLQMEDLVEFLASHKVEIVSSLPCYLEENVDKQRGQGVFRKSIDVLNRLNHVGYGKDPALLLNLVYNPQGASLPPAQENLEHDYKKILAEKYGVVFNNLYTIANMPINRFAEKLEKEGRMESYMALLKEQHKEENLAGVMCKSLVSVDWQGFLYDCDFNQMLDIPLSRESKTHVNDFNRDLNGCRIAVADHCFACTAGKGSSCGGALS